MNKTISISIDNKKFDLEEGAYKTLDKYLTSVHNHFATHEDKVDIIADIENSIAEKFIDKISKHKNVITEDDVDGVIKSMGTVDDFKKFDQAEGSKAESAPAENQATQPASAKKLYRDPDDKILGGVSSGLAAYFNTDATLIRILFILTTIIWGFGIVVYIILWIFVPEAKTAAQKIEMYGGQATLANIEKKITTTASSENQETRKAIRQVLGWILIIISGLVLAGMFFLATLLNIFSAFVSGIFPSLLALVFLGLIFSPFIFVFYFGIKLIKNQEISKAMIITFIILMLLIGSSGFMFLSHFSIIPSYPGIF